jgi:hypothetical protein
MQVDDTSIVAVGKTMVIYDRRTHRMIKKASDHEGDMYGVFFDDKSIATCGFNSRGTPALILLDICVLTCWCSCVCFSSAVGILDVNACSMCIAISN